MADGQVVINTKIDTQGMTAGSKEVEASLRRLADSIDGIGEKSELSLEKQINSFARTNSQYATQQKKVSELKQSLDELGKAQVPTEEYTEIANQIENAEKKLNSLTERQDKFLATGGKTNSKTYKNMQYDVEELRNEIEYAKADMEDLQASGGAFTAGTDTEEYAAMEEQYSAATEKLEQMNNSLSNSYDSLMLKMREFGTSTQETAATESEAANTTEEANQKTTGFRSTLENIGARAQEVAGTAGPALKNAFSNIGNTARKAASHISKMVTNLTKVAGRAIKSGIDKLKNSITGVGNSANGAGNSLKNMVKAAIGINSLRTLFNKLKSWISEGFENLRAYSSETDQSMTALENSLTTLKNSFAAAFSPIVNVVAPILTSFINQLSTVMDYVGRFFATLTGQTTYTKAVAVQEDYADALDNTAASATEAAKAVQYFSGLDEVSTFSSNNSSGSGSGSGTGGTSASDMFETVALEPLSISFDSWGEAFDAFLDFLLNDGVPALEKALNKCVDVVNKFAANLYEMFTFPGVLEKVQQLGKDLGEAFNRITDRIDWSTIGGALGAGFNLAIQFLVNFIYTYSWSNLGSNLAEMINNAIKEVNWKSFGQLMWSKFKIAIELFTGFLLGLDMKDIAKAASNIVTGFFDSMTETISGINWKEVGQQIKTFLMSFKWEEIGTSIATSLNTIVAAVDDLNLGGSLSALMSGALGFLTSAVETFNWTGLGETLKGFIDGLDWDGLAADVAELFNGLVVAVEDLNLGETFSLLITDACGAISTALQVFDWENLGSTLAEMVQTIDFAGAFSSAAEVLGEAVTAFLDLIIGFAETFDWFSLPGVIFDSISGILGSVNWGEIIAQIFELLGSAIAGAAQLIAGFASNLWSAIVGAVTSVFDYFKESIDGCGQNFILGMLDGIINGLLNIGEWIYEHIVEPIINGVRKAFGLDELEGSNIFAIGKDLINGMFDGITSLFSDIKGWIKEHIVDPFLGGIKSLFGIASPSTEMESVGTMMMEGLFNGITSLVDSVIGIFSGIKEKIGEKWDEIKSDVKEKWGDIKENLSEKWGNIKEKATTTFSNIKTSVSTTFSNLKTKLSDTASNIKDTLSDKFSSAKETISDTFSGLKDTVTTKFSDTKDKLTDTVSGIKDKLTSKFSDMKDDLSGTTSGIETDLTSGFSSAESSLSNITSSIGNVSASDFTKLQSNLKTTVNNIKENLTSTFNSIKSSLTSTTSNLTSSIQSSFNTLKSNLSSSASSMSSSLTSAFSTMQKNLTNTAESTWSAIKKTFTNGASDIANIIQSKDWASIGSAICSGIQRGINNGWTALNNTVSSLAQSMLKTAERSLGIASPSKKFRDSVGKMIPAGISVGIEKGFPDTLTTLKDQANRLLDVPIVASSVYIPEPRIPYLASGAVIPPQSEFLAVLGDQKSGNNIEAPEDLLRRIVREETANNSQGNDTYRFTAQINRRTLFDEFIEEAKIRQMQTGKSPFDLA